MNTLPSMHLDNTLRLAQEVHNQNAISSMTSTHNLQYQEGLGLNLRTKKTHPTNNATANPLPMTIIFTFMSGQGW